MHGRFGTSVADAAKTVAEALGLTRFTVYNHLHRIRDHDSEPTGPAGILHHAVDGVVAADLGFRHS